MNIFQSMRNWDSFFDSISCILQNEQIVLVDFG